MNNLNLSYFSSSYIDYNDIKIQKFVLDFRNRYNIEPSDYAFTGFDITYYFLNSLFNLGDSFYDCIEFSPQKLLKSTYHFKRVGNTNNFENSYWNMLQIDDMILRKIPNMSKNYNLN